MSLEKYTLQELQDEIWAREQVQKEEFLCVGIIDVDGAESIILCESKEKFAETVRSLQLRARFNSQRHPVVYCSKMPRALFDAFDKAIREGKHIRAGETIKSLSNFKSLGY